MFIKKQMNYSKSISIIVILSLLLIDIMLKQTLKKILLYGDINIINGFIKLKLAFNEGIAFSIPFKGNIMIITTLVILVFIFYMRLKESNTLNKFAFDMMLSGGIGNLLDRIMYGKVTDFISILSFPIFNIADVCIVVGFILYSLNILINFKCINNY